jgi:L-lactate utilization protein LutC
MEVTTYTKEKNLLLTKNKSKLLDSFLSNSNNLDNEALKVETNLFIEAANQKNIQFEFIRMKSCKLDRTSFDISNAKNALIEADFALADTGTLIVDTEDPNVLLTVFMAEVLHVVVPASKILYSMHDLELIKGKRAVKMGRGIASVSLSSPAPEHRFSRNIVRTMVYVLEDM